MQETRFQCAREIVGDFLDQLKARGLVEAFYAVEIPATQQTGGAEKIYVQAADFAERYQARRCTPKGDYALTLCESASGTLSVMFESVAASATHDDVMDTWISMRSSENPIRRRGAFKDVSQPEFQSYLSGLETLMSASAPALRDDARQQGLKTEAPARRF